MIHTGKGQSIEERVNKTIRILLEKAVFLAGNADWLSELPSVFNQNNNSIHNSTKMKPINASKKANKKQVYSNLQYRRVRQKPKIKLGQPVQTADLKKLFSKDDSTNWSYKLITKAEINQDTILSYRINFLPKKYNQNLLLPTNLYLDENNEVIKELNLIQKYNKE